MIRYWPLLLLLSACSTIEYVPVSLPLPPKPELPTLEGPELMCLTDDTYVKLVQRDRLQSGHIKVLEAIILSTQETQKND